METPITIAAFLSSLQILANPLCLFGDHLVQTARYKDLEFSEELMNTRGIFKLAPLVLEGFDSTNDSLWTRTITHKTTQNTYLMMLSDPGDNIAGGFVEGNKVVAVVGDGSIGGCKVYFNPEHNVFFKKIQGKQPDSASSSGYFGAHLAELERLSQFIVKSYQRPESNRITTYNDVYVAAYNADYKIIDTLTDTNYLISTQDNLIVTEKAPHFQVAKLQNGWIINSASFEEYDSLPWFYTN